MEYKMVTAGTREAGGQGVIEDSVELVAVLDAKVNDAIRLGWRSAASSQVQMVG